MWTNIQKAWLIHGTKHRTPLEEHEIVNANLT